MSIVENKIKSIISKQLNIGINNINNNDDIIKNLGADSLDIIELVMEIEHIFNIEISDENIKKIKDINSIIEYLKNNHNIK